MKRVRKLFFAVLIVMASTLVVNATTNVYWKTWLVLPSVYDFNTAANWQYVNWSGDATTFGANEIANFPFWYNSDQWTRDWRLHFSENITNYSAQLKAPTVGHAATFDLDGRTWSLTGLFQSVLGKKRPNCFDERRFGRWREYNAVRDLRSQWPENERGSDCPRYADQRRNDEYRRDTRRMQGWRSDDNQWPCRW